jgi:hypothetical protein
VNRVRTPSSLVRERERERERDKGREKERERERERERKVEYVFQLPRIVIFIFKRKDGCLGTFKLSGIE